MPRQRRVGSLLSLDLPKTRAGHGGPAIEGWWAHMDSDHGPRPYQRRALTS